MKPFRKRKRKTTTEHSAFLQKCLTVAHNYLQRLNVWLQIRSNPYSDKKKKLLLYIFCCTSALTCFCIVYDTLSQHRSQWLFVMPFHVIKLPKDALQQTHISSTEIQKLSMYQAYIDSLQKVYKINDDSENLKNAIKMQDTINLLQNLYYEQQSKSK